MLIEWGCQSLAASGAVSKVEAAAGAMLLSLGAAKQGRGMASSSRTATRDTCLALADAG